MALRQPDNKAPSPGPVAGAWRGVWGAHTCCPPSVRVCPWFLLPRVQGDSKTQLWGYLTNVAGADCISRVQLVEHR